MKSNIVLIAVLLAGLLVASGCTSSAAAATPDQQFTLRTDITDSRMVYVGVGGVIDGVINPDLTVRIGDGVQIEVLNGDGIPHDLALPDLGIQTAQGMIRGKTVGVTFTAGRSGVYSYICTVAGHRQAGMEGRLVVTP